MNITITEVDLSLLHPSICFSTTKYLVSSEKVERIHEFSL